MRISFKTFIKIDRRKSEPIYLQIVYQFIQAVQQNLLSDGFKIPGSRVLSKELKVHRKTVIAAIEELQLQGWVETKPAVGTFVRNPEIKNKNSGIYHLPKKADFSFKRSFILDSFNQQNQEKYKFTTGKPDYRIIKPEELGRFYAAALKRKRILKKSDEFLETGNDFFKEQLSFYINLTQGFHISKNNLLNITNKQILLYILTQLLITPGDQVLVANYSDDLSNMVFQQAGAKLKTIPMDEEGIRVDFIRNNFKKESIKCVYLHPKYQIPTTKNFSEKRKKDLLQLAVEYNFILIEDGGNTEFNYDKSLHLPILKLDDFGKTIYLGTFGKFLPPGFQTNFMIAPENFMQEARKYLNIFGNVDVVKEQALAEMIAQGDIHRYRRKALKIYELRRNKFAELLKEFFGESIKFTIPQGGLAFWVEFKENISLLKLIENCKTKKLYLPFNSLFQDKKTTALRLGFADLNEEEMRGNLKIVKTAYQEQINFILL